MKPIVKIEAPQGLTKEDLEGIHESLKDAPLTKEYHVLLISGNTDYFSVEIITASDIKLHLPA